MEKESRKIDLICLDFHISMGFNNVGTPDINEINFSISFLSNQYVRSGKSLRASLSRSSNLIYIYYIYI